MILALAVVVLAAPLFAAPRTWIVDANGAGDFDDIPAAITAASDGDVILVRAVPDVSYSGFTLNRKVTVKAETTVVQVDSSIVVDSIPAGSGGAVVSGFVLADGVHPLLSVTSCDGDVVVDDVQIPQAAGATEPAIGITSSASVSLHDCEVLGVAVDPDHSAPLVSVDHSNVRACHVTWTGGIGISDADGQVALSVIASTIAFEEASITGGQGDVVYVSGGHSDGVPTVGGIAVVVSDSTLWFVGDESAAIRGGAGGTYYDLDTGFSSYGNAGGDAFDLVRTFCTVSRSVVAGGEGDPDGEEYGDDFPYTRDDSYPFLSLEPELHVGQPSTLTLDAAPRAGTAILLLSDQGGAGEAGYKWLGPPLAVLGSTIYFVNDLGGLDGNGDWSVTVDVPDEPSAAGMTWHLQAAVFEHTGVLYLTNPVARTVGL